MAVNTLQLVSKILMESSTSNNWELFSSWCKGFGKPWQVSHLLQLVSKVFPLGKPQIWITGISTLLYQPLSAGQDVLCAAESFLLMQRFWEVWQATFFNSKKAALRASRSSNQYLHLEFYNTPTCSFQYTQKIMLSKCYVQYTTQNILFVFKFPKPNNRKCMIYHSWETFALSQVVF